MACFGSLSAKLETEDRRIEILRDLESVYVYAILLFGYDLKMDEPRFFSAFRNVLVASSVPIKLLKSSSSRPFESDFILEDRAGKADSSSLEAPFYQAYNLRPEQDNKKDIRQVERMNMYPLSRRHQEQCPIRLRLNMSEKKEKLGLTMSGKSAYLVPLIW